MTMHELECKLRDTSISDKDFFELLVKYFEERERDDTPIEQEDIVALHQLRKLTKKMRPAALEMMRRYVLKQHEGCCMPKTEE